MFLTISPEAMSTDRGSECFICNFPFNSKKNYLKHNLKNKQTKQTEYHLNIIDEPEFGANDID